MGRFIEPVKRLAGKKALHNGMWLYLLQIFNTVIPLVTLPYITRILGPSQYGLFSISLNLQGYYQVIVEYGFGMSATRKVALQENSEESLRGLYSRVLASRLILMLPCIVLTIVYTLFNYSQVDQCVCLAILTATMIGYCFQLNWLFQGMQCMRFVSISNIIGLYAETWLVVQEIGLAFDLDSRKPGEEYGLVVEIQRHPLVADDDALARVAVQHGYTVLGARLDLCNEDLLGVDDAAAVFDVLDALGILAEGRVPTLEDIMKSYLESCVDVPAGGWGTFAER